MKAIWKTTLMIVDFQTISLPKKHTLLCVQNQGGFPCIWFENHDVGCVFDIYNVIIYGTGHEHEKFEGLYIGTVQIDHFAWHVYIEKAN